MSQCTSSSALSLMTLPPAASASRVMGIGHDDGNLIQSGVQLRQPVDGEDCIRKDKSYSLRMARSCLTAEWDRGIVETARGKR